MSTPHDRPPHNAGGWYEIRIKGHLATRWAMRFEPMTLTTEDGGTTLIRGPVVDQAGLHGLLRQLSDLGLPLISVTQVGPDRPPALKPNLHDTHIKEQS